VAKSDPTTIHAVAFRPKQIHLSVVATLFWKPSMVAGTSAVSSFFNAMLQVKSDAENRFRYTPLRTNKELGA
jgi:hypothetical protein